ncbi:hypothetical protein M0811_13203 [Anaeramoeba ignava]|uniref:Uncharacterized protein n=1 Tax=Anaeramoeba ignava TaxID=1746090 RepID=A0A9Q0R5V5_ANAIG|nr:hypothetical protein M0811_13203 [Anaeramoeba ignava]
MNLIFLFFILFNCFILLVQSEVNLLDSYKFPPIMNNPYQTFIDENDGFLYFLDIRGGGSNYLLKYDLYTFDLLDYTKTEVENGKYGAIDNENKLLYIAPYGSNILLKFDLNTFQIIDNLTLSVSNTSYADMIEIDLINQKVYIEFGNPIIIVKVDLNGWNEESNLTLSNYQFIGSVIDVDNGILYVSTDTSSGTNATIYKIELSTFTQIDYLLVNLTSVGKLQYGVIDNSTQMMYFGTYQNPMRIVKINLTDFTSVDSINASSSQYCMGAGIDSLNGIAYFSSANNYLFKVNLTTFTIEDSYNWSGYYTKTIGINSDVSKAYIPQNKYQITEINLPSLTEGNSSNFISYTDPRMILTDELNRIGYIYFYDLNGIIAKVDLESFELVDYLLLSLSDTLYYGEIDSINGFIYLFLTYNDVKIMKIRLSNFSIDETVSIYSNVHTFSTVFDQQNQILYVGCYNNTDDYAYLFKMNSPDLQILNSFQLAYEVIIYGLYLDSFHNYLYCLIYNDSGVGTEYFISKHQLPNLNQISTANLTEYNVYYPVLDKTHELIYFGDYDNYLICRVDLTNMEVMNDCLNISDISDVDDFLESFINSNDNWVYFLVKFYNSTSDEYFKSVLQIDTISNQLISTTNVDDEIFEDSIYAYDPTKNYGYLVYYYNELQSYFYQISLPNSTLPPNPPSSSEEIIFNFSILGIMIILSLF